MKRQSLTEEDMLTIFAQEMRKKPRMTSIFTKILILAGVLIIVFLASNFGAFRDQFDYWYSKDYASESPAVIQESVVKSTEISDEQKKQYLPPIANDYLNIPTIDVYAPVIWDIQNNPTAVEENLKNGVIHIDESVLPGEKGNVFITGHSSNYAWAEGNYKSVFALLNKLAVGDTIQLKHKNKDYIYEVAEKQIVKSDQLSVIKDAKNTHQLTLMSCWPIGTALRRLIVTAKQIYPDQNQILTPDANQVQGLEINDMWN